MSPDALIEVMGTIASAIISAVVAVAVVLTKGRVDRKRASEEERKDVNLQYLSPLRLYMEETYFRLYEIRNRIAKEGGQCKDLLYVSRVEEVSEQSDEWFNGHGCYLISSCYFTACLFYHIKKLKDERPYLRLTDEDDTILLTLISDVSRAFLKDLGVYYATQSSIGSDVYLNSENRLLTYREFCQLLQDPRKRVWFDRLIKFYIQTGQGKVERVDFALDAIRTVSLFLDETVGGGPSIEKRLLAEQTLQQKASISARDKKIDEEKEPERFAERIGLVIQQTRERVRRFSERLTAILK